MKIPKYNNLCIGLQVVKTKFMNYRCKNGMRIELIISNTEDKYLLLLVINSNGLELIAITTYIFLTINQSFCFCILRKNNKEMKRSGGVS